MKHTKLILTFISSLALSVATLNAYAGSDNTNSDDKVSLIETGHKIDAKVIEGKVEGALLMDKHLNNFKIDIDVNDNVVSLSGDVDSSAEKALAEQIALSIDGVSSVDNQLKVKKESREGHSEEEITLFKDALITAKVKTNLLTNSSVSGTSIEVSTDQSVVTLSGKVKSDIESDLAEKITANIDDVKSVENELTVSSR